MRVALIHMRHALSGGTERYLNALASELAGRGHETTIVCRSHVQAPHPAVRFQVLHDLALGGAARMLAFARAVERHVRATPYDLTVGLGKTWTHDVIRLGGGCHASYLEKAHRYTLSRWERILRSDRRKHRLALEIEARALAPGAFRLVLVNSEMVRRDVMARHGVPATRIATVPNGVDLARFSLALRASAGAELRAHLGLEPQALVLGFLGTGYGRKGLDRLLGAFALLLRRAPHARLLVAGRDAQPARFERLALDLGVRAQTRFLGPTDAPERVLAACDLYALPTRYDTFALSILEALACGVPVVTTAAAGGSEVLDESVGTVLAEDASDAELCDALAAWTDPERLAAARPRARARAERYPAERTARESAALLEGVARERAAPAGSRA